MRRVLDVVFSARARVHLVWLDRIRSDRTQLHTLRRLVRRHARSEFALAHDFARIREEADFRRLVPLRRPSTLALTDDILAIHRRGLRAALALCIHGCARRVQLLTRPVVWLGDEATRDRWLPRLLRGLVVPTPTTDSGCLIGPASLVTPWASSSSACISWNDGTPALGMELLVRPEGTIAVNDPRYNRFRLLTDHGVYYEFIPVNDQGAARPRRLGIAQTKPGETYELVVSTPGAWATRTNLGVVFDRPGSPLFRRVDLPFANRGQDEGLASPLTPNPVTTEPQLHPRIDDSPATLPEKFARTPWSAHEDRG